MTKKNNLSDCMQHAEFLLCMTPLHVLTAQAISEELGCANFLCGAYVTSQDDPKSRHYATKMKNFCKRVEFKVVDSDASYGRWKHAEILIRRRRYISWLKGLGEFSSCLIPSSLSHYAYAVPSAYAGSTISTYDDGVLNIQPNSQIISCKLSIGTRLFLAISGIRHWPSRLIRQSDIHYTLYSSNNAYGEARQVKLFSCKHNSINLSNNNARLGIVRILLGPPPEADIQVLNLFKNTSLHVQFDGVLAHPRFADYDCEGLPLIKTNLIAEDYVLQILLAGRYEMVEVYGYESSALLNLAGLSGIRCLSLLENSDREKVMRSLMARCGVEMLFGESS